MPLTATATEEAESTQPAFIRDSLLGSWYWKQTPTHAELQEWIRFYYRLVMGVDIAVSRLVAELDELGFSDNTVRYNRKSCVRV